MKSGLEGRNNEPGSADTVLNILGGLNEVRPRRPEQSLRATTSSADGQGVSMKSGLEGRNNGVVEWVMSKGNEDVSMKSGLEGRNNHRGSASTGCVPRPVSMKSGLEGRNNIPLARVVDENNAVSMKSGLEGRNNKG